MRLICILDSILAYWPPELSRCSAIEEFQFCYCPPLLPTASASLQNSNWLHDIVASLQATSVSILILSLDFRHLGDANSAPSIIDFAQRFLDEHHCTEIDATLVNPGDCKKLERVGLFFMCGLSMSTEFRAAWRAAARTKFPRLCARRLLE